MPHQTNERDATCKKDFLAEPSDAAPPLPRVVARLCPSNLSRFLDSSLGKSHAKSVLCSAAQSGGQTPRSLGVRSVVKRNQPARLDLAPPRVGTGLDGYNLSSHLPFLRDVAAQPVVIRAPRRSLRHWFGQRLIARGSALIGSARYPLGQPAQ
jgi:hypothetical protein